MTLKKEDLFDGLIITGSPAEINRAITEIISAGFSFEPHFDANYIGDAIVVVDPNTKAVPVQELSPAEDLAAIEEAFVEPAPAPVEVEVAVEPAEEVNVDIEGDLLPDVEVSVDVEPAEEVEVEAPKPAPRRGRKPKAESAPESVEE